MRILIIDDHPLFIDNIRHNVKLLANEVDITEANSADDALKHMESPTNFDLVLLKSHMPGLDAASIIQHHKTLSTGLPIVIISGDKNPDTIQPVIESGVKGFIPKAYPEKKLLHALRTIMEGEIYTPDGINTQDSNHSQSCNIVAHNNGITRRQLQVLELLANGYSNKKISNSLFLTENTVKSHISALFKALSASNRTECVNIARHRGIIN